MKKEYDFKKLKKRHGKAKVDVNANKIPISIRLDSSDLSQLRTEAERLGLPYQTFIGSVLHRYTTAELVDESAVDFIKKLRTA